MAPRPLLAFEGDRDFPREGVQPMLDEARGKYALLDAADRFRWGGTLGAMEPTCEIRRPWMKSAAGSPATWVEVLRCHDQPSFL